MGHISFVKRVVTGLVTSMTVAVTPTLVQAQVTNRVIVPSGPFGTITVIDAATKAIVGTPVNSFGATDVAVTPDGRSILVVNGNLDTLARYSLDPLSGAAVDTVSVGLTPSGVAVTPDGRKAYVTAVGEVTVVDLTTMTVAQHISIPTVLPGGVAISADGAQAFVPEGDLDDVVVIDVATDTTVGAPIAVGSGPVSIAARADGRVLVTNFDDDTVSVISAAGVVVDTIPVGSGPWGVAISPDWTMAYVANSNDGTISVIDLLTDTVINTLPIISSCGCAGGPTGVVFTPDGRSAYVILSGTDEVAVVDVQTSTQTSTFIPVGLQPLVFGNFISPNLIVSGNGPLVVPNDGALTSLGFGRFVTFSGGTLQLSSDLTTTRDLSILGSGGTIDTNGFHALVTGTIVNEGPLTTIGNGRLTLTGTGIVTPLAVTGGTLELNGSHDGTVSFAAHGTLAGTGTLATVVATGGTISPGAADGPGVLHVHDATFNQATTVSIQLNGPTVGSGYDRLDATGSITLGKAALDLHVGYVPAPGATFVIATHVTGTFQGLPEGAIVTAGVLHFRISYHGGSGDDATLIADEPPQITGLTDQTIYAGNTLGPLAFGVSDDLAGAGAIAVSVTSSNASLPLGLLLGGSGAVRTLSATTTASTAAATTWVTVIASDGVQNRSATFTLTVLPQPVYSLAEGATSAFFDTDILLANPNSAPAPITVTFFRDDATTLILHRTLPATSRTTIRAKEVDGLEAASFSTSVTSNSGLPLVVERTMWWDASGYGAHGEKASSGPALQWYFAEGSQGFFHTYFLLLNPNAAANVAHVTYLLEDGAPVVRDYALAETSRLTVDVAAEPALANKSFGALVTFDLPGMAERAMYFGTSPIYTGGTDSAGVTAPAKNWLLAEGATGDFFDTFVLIANPGDVDATVTMTYLPAIGSPIVKTHTLAAHQRLTINIADEDPTLASAAVGTQIAADQPVVVERSMYWPHGNWYEAHNTTADTTADVHWGLAEGRVGGPQHAQTYILLANPGTQTADVTATFLRTNGTTIVKTFSVPPSSRRNIAITGPDSDVPELADEQFGATLVATHPVIVERSLYTDANGLTWAAGTNATGTRLP